MPVTKVVEIIKRVENVLQDTNIRWPRLELQEWLNEAYSTILLARPDANARTGAYTCVPGTRQQVTTGFADALRVLDVPRNLAATSSKKAVRLIRRDVLDDQRPSWHAEVQSVDIQYWMFDPRQPKEFFVYPPATALAQLEVVYTAPVGTHSMLEAALAPDSGDTTTILVDDVYAGPLVDWLLYRSYSKDADYAANSSRAALHLQAFTDAIGAKNSTDAAADPKNDSSVT